MSSSWKDRFNKQPATNFSLPFDAVRVSEDKKTVALIKNNKIVDTMHVNAFLKFISEIEQEHLNFDKAGLLKLIGDQIDDTSGEIKADSNGDREYKEESIGAQ